MRQEAFSIDNVVVCRTYNPTAPSGSDELLGDFDTYQYSTTEMAEAVAAASNMRIVRLP